MNSDINKGALRIEPVRRAEDGGTGDRWLAMWGDDYDGGGATIEEALMALAMQMGNALDAEIDKPYPRMTTDPLHGSHPFYDEADRG